MVFVNFNQDCTSLAVGSNDGYQLYAINDVDKIDCIYDCDAKDISIIERLFNSSLIVTVNKSTPCSIRLSHFKKRTEICSYNYPSKIISVKLNRQRLIVWLDDEYHIHDIRNMTVLQVNRTGYSSEKALFALSSGNETGLLAYPGSLDSGRLEIFDAISLTKLVNIEAHNNPLAAVAFTARADLVATASVKGTVIRIFSPLTGSKLYEFRRGLKRCVDISSLGFSQDGFYLAASSNTETVHIFKLDQKPVKSESVEDSTWAGYITSAFVTSAVSLMPTKVSDALNAWRSFATAHLSDSNRFTVCGIAYINRTPHVYVADTQGLLSVFKMDIMVGGECSLVTTRRLLPSDHVSRDRNLDISSEEPSKSPVRYADKQSDASYAYKLKREKTVGPSTASQELNEILDNVPKFDCEDNSESGLGLDDQDEFPPIN